ncbi:L-threonylcarbamoyladenylate synthase [Actinocorallia populi]|uniref:L-threonylcarbamoyladenylate synthase n=1 Tax=Actinocorallia populi TaxID=2079200 RepID=UPI000D08B886|nr:L-threonylcarbamoyladenylate synthase [Actinocorallia populi]
MSRHYDCSDPLERVRGIADAASCLRRGELVVLPTDTVYGIAADAFTPPAVQRLLDAKGRGRDMPPPVLVGSVRAATALIEDLGPYGQDLIDEFWPGALTVVCQANPSLSWNLGETKGTVAVRMPLHDLALELLKETGPLAVSSANLSGSPAARTAAEAEEMLGESVAVYLDGGPAGEGRASSIVDLTGSLPKLLRRGAIREDKIRAVCGVLLRDEDLGDDEDEDDPSALLHLDDEDGGEAGRPVAFEKDAASVREPADGEDAPDDKDAADGPVPPEVPAEPWWEKKDGPER